MDREKVIKEYEDYVNSYIPVTTYGDYVLEMHKAVLALLNEQDKIIQNILCEKTNELNNKVATLQIELQNQEIRRLLEKKNET